TQVDFGEALADFREGTTTTSPATVAAVTSPGEVAIAPNTSPTTEAAPTTTAPPSVPSTAPATTPDTAAPAGPFQLPAEGVYRYRTSGGETISLLGARHDYPAETYAAVRHLGGCRWHVRAEVVAEHTDERLMCSEPGRLLQLEQARLVTFFGTTDGGR